MFDKCQSVDKMYADAREIETDSNDMPVHYNENSPDLIGDYDRDWEANGLDKPKNKYFQTKEMVGGKRGIEGAKLLSDNPCCCTDRNNFWNCKADCKDMCTDNKWKSGWFRNILGLVLPCFGYQTPYGYEVDGRKYYFNNAYPDLDANGKLNLQTLKEETPSAQFEDYAKQWKKQRTKNKRQDVCGACPFIGYKKYGFTPECYNFDCCCIDRCCHEDKGAIASLFNKKKQKKNKDHFNPEREERKIKQITNPKNMQIKDREAQPPKGWEFIINGKYGEGVAEPHDDVKFYLMPPSCAGRFDGEKTPLVKEFTWAEFRKAYTPKWVLKKYGQEKTEKQAFMYKTGAEKFKWAQFDWSLEKRIKEEIVTDDWYVYWTGKQTLTKRDAGFKQGEDSKKTVFMWTKIKNCKCEEPGKKFKLTSKLQASWGSNDNGIKEYKGKEFCKRHEVKTAQNKPSYGPWNGFSKPIWANHQFQVRKEGNAEEYVDNGNHVEDNGKGRHKRYGTRNIKWGAKTLLKMYKSAKTEFEDAQAASNIFEESSEDSDFSDSN